MCVCLFLHIYCVNFNTLCTHIQPVKKKAGSGKKKSTGKKKGGGKKKGKSKGKGKSSKVEKPAPVVADPLSYAAMVNAYYISHGPVQFLQFRGYNWAGAGAKGKKKKGGKKKK